MNSITAQLPTVVRTFAQLLSPTRRGARLARLLTAEELRTWGVPSGIRESVERIVAELAANAVLHGQVRGRNFRLVLALDAEAGTLRIEVADARGERLPTPRVGHAETDSGRGLLLVEALADAWGVMPRSGGGKTVWALVLLPEK